MCRPIATADRRASTLVYRSPEKRKGEDGAVRDGFCRPSTLAIELVTFSKVYSLLLMLSFRHGSIPCDKNWQGNRPAAPASFPAMKEEANIAMGLLTASKWQPSVLQLLPFSNNNVGVKRHAQGVPSATYSESGADREFPLLAVTRSENANARPRSKSASASASASANFPSRVLTSQVGVSERKFGQGQGQQRRLFRASSERLARGAERTSTGNAQASHGTDRHKNKLRAQSDYGISTYKRPEVVKISVSDINEQILGNNRVRSAVTLEDSMNPKLRESSNGVVRVKLNDDHGGEAEIREIRKEEETRNKALFPKSALKPTQGRWPNSGLTFWSSETGSPNTANVRGTPRNFLRARGGDVTANGLREANTAPAEIYFRKDGRRVKLNVNELPRSKTPITENDPDKLNMQHVIAFLQSSGSGDENLRRSEIETMASKIKSSQQTNSTSKRSAINGVITASPDQDGLVSIRPSHTTARTGAASPGKGIRFLSDVEDEKTPHRLSFKKAQVEDEKAAHGKPGAESMELYRKTRAGPTSSGGILQYSEFKTHSVNLSEKPGITSPGYPTLDDIHIPLSIRKIRDSAQGGDTKPFRLHRFLTLVSKGPEIKAPEKIERSAGGAAQSKNIGSRDKKRAFRKGSGNDKIDKPHMHQRRYHPDSNLYYLDVSTPFDDRPRSKVESRGSSKSRLDELEADQLRRDVQRVIRLPRAHYEADSDEEGSPYCTVPAARNKRALTLSAQGRAIKNIVAENNNKLGLAQRQANRQFVPKDTKSKEGNSDSTDNHTTSGKHAAKNTQEGNVEAIEMAATEIKTNTHEDLEPVKQAQKEKPNDSEMLLAEKPDMSTDKVSAVTFRDVLDLKSEPGGNSSSKDSPGATTEAGGTTFLTQAPPSSSPPHSLSPVNVNQQITNNAARGSPVSKKGSSMTNGSSPSPMRDHVKLSLRKEKNKTRELTYMFPVENGGLESFSPSPK
ncbi:hypothetical protein EGW08_006069 [Elysia chlorotica]|uniref:Uncharacterized protein n=1 Tax=Elysia chlorotica TaxID=188477 RepID=A0A3S1HU40_ELYCH|nr:hypothetical protein EGW08_006069 [Elysia chlorotica]